MSTPAGQGPGGAERLGLTTPRQALVSLLAGGVVGYFIVGTMRLRGDVVPLTPWSIPALLFVMGVAALGYAPVLRRQVREERARISPELALRALAMGKTMLMTGAIVAGGHLVYVAFFAGQWGVDLPRQRVVRGLLTIACAVLFAVGGRQLEKACMVPPTDDEPSDPSTSA